MSPVGGEADAVVLITVAVTGMAEKVVGAVDEAVRE